MSFKKYITRLIILIGILFFTRVLFQFPVEYFNIDILKQTAQNRLFSKIDALVAIVFVGLFFSFYYKQRIEKLGHNKISWAKSFIYLIAGELFIVAYYGLRYLTNYYGITSGTNLLLIQAGIIICLIAALIFMAIAIFQAEYLKKFYMIFKKELPIYAAAAVILYAALMFFQSKWLFFSTMVSKVLYVLLSLFYPVYLQMMPGGPLLVVKDFAVSIGAPCSGIDSMLLFTAFFAGIFALDYKNIRKGRYIIFFIAGLIGVFFVNIIRLFLLILIGANFSPDFAVGMFHTNAGWIFFIIYFLGYYLLIKRFIYLKNK